VVLKENSSVKATESRYARRNAPVKLVMGKGKKRNYLTVQVGQKLVLRARGMKAR
jgi:hypothetical protein